MAYKRFLLFQQEARFRKGIRKDMFLPVVTACLAGFIVSVFGITVTVTATVI